MIAPTTTANNPALSGQLASRKVLYGDFDRFATFAVHTRFDAVQWFTADAFDLDDKGLPKVIRQTATFAEAIA